MSVVILIYYRKAFGLVNGLILMQELQAYGLVIKSFMWFQSTLSERCIGSVESSTTQVHFAVPQGFIVGQLLFIKSKTSLCVWALLKLIYMMGHIVNIFNLATGLLVFLRYFANLGTFLPLFLVRAHYSGPNDKLLSHYLSLETSLMIPWPNNSRIHGVSSYLFHFWRKEAFYWLGIN